MPQSCPGVHVAVAKERSTGIHSKTAIVLHHHVRVCSMTKTHVTCRKGENDGMLRLSEQESKRAIERERERERERESLTLFAEAVGPRP